MLWVFPERGRENLLPVWMRAVTAFWKGGKRRPVAGTTILEARKKQTVPTSSPYEKKSNSISAQIVQ
jgi:hypothetical protein